MDPLQEHWDRLGIAPTTDTLEIRRAYARLLKSVDPETDPAGFQALRHSLEALMASQTRAAPDAPNQQEAASAFERQLSALRAAGDTHAAIALVDRLFADHRPGDPLLDAIGDTLFRGAALDRTLSPELFMHLVARFGWRDASGPAAQADPQRHSVLLARVAAEDWYRSLAAGEERSGALVPAALLTRGGQIRLPPGGLDKAQKEEARTLMAALLDMGQFLLDRFDARSLAALREAVEGPPLVAVPPPPAPAAIPRPTVPRRRWSRRAITRAALVAVVALSAIVRLAETQSGTPAVELTPAVRARQVLDQTTDSWIALRPFNGQVLVYFTQLLTNRAALASVRYGLDSNIPNRDFPLPPNSNAWPQPIGPDTNITVTAPANLRFVSVQVTYTDGSASPVRIVRRGTGDSPGNNQ